MKKLTIVDVAKRAKVSKGTVSAVINGKSNVKASTRDHILEVMKELNYRPKGVARNLKVGQPEKSIGLILKDLSYPFYTSIAAGAKEYAKGMGYAVVVASSDDNHETEKQLTRLFSAKDIKGAIIAPIVAGTAEIEHLFRLKMINYPFVLLEDVQGIQANVVAIDNIKAIKRAVKYLIENGHRKIVHFAGPPQSSHTLERVEGFRHAFSESPLVFKKENIVSIGSHFDESYAKTIEYFHGLSRQEYPTAIVCFNDHQALAVMLALKKLEVRIPQDISLVGIDDIYYAKMYPIPLTTIQAPHFEIGMRAAEILIRNIEASHLLPVERVVLETEFIVRETTQPLLQSVVERSELQIAE
ncbi:MAG TPA: LacI family DNA-binding transcriptional regulator [Bacteroidota bacterium]|nr:LacI family DNA-binding transcriptional regulator [Bacteroidota bacterium]